MTRLIALACVAFALGPVGDHPAAAQTRTTTTAANQLKSADLKDRLERDLRARRPSEFAFIARVIELVDDGVLPLGMVNSTYLWARKQTVFPFQHFQRGIRVRAEKLGVDI